MPLARPVKRKPPPPRMSHEGLGRYEYRYEARYDWTRGHYVYDAIVVWVPAQTEG